MKNHLIVFTLILSSKLVLSNGGSIAEGGFINECNTITLLTEKDFSLESEDLTLHVEEDYIFVTAVYLIKNRSIKRNIRYGFAVDYRDSPNSNTYYWEDDYISDFKIINNGIELKYEYKDEKNIKMDSVYYSRYDTGEVIDTISRRWYISELDFNDKECKQLIVCYRVKTNYADWPMMSVYSLDYESTPYSDRKFAYYLKPSGFWGNGEVGNFRLRITFDNIEKYDEFTIHGIDGIKKGENGYSIETTNFNLLSNTHLKLNYNYEKWEESQNSWRFNNSEIIDGYKCSSQHRKHPVSNLFDKDKNTTWAPITDGRNNWIEITFKRNVVLFGVGILNGNTKDNQAYANGNIVTKAKVIVYEDVGEGSDSIVSVIDLKRKSLSNDFIFYFTGIEDILYGGLYGDEAADYKEGFALTIAKSVRIELLDNDRVSNVDDAYISELMLYGVIDERR